ncbi:hypothetical protein [Mycobacteroides salmoniphilum]|uniref:Uncharacterized protein n=1 Tax=Mycobacteroides salmoniphilum TaxID=404941 RepID=A0A4R8SSF7_9MYCO|nr:hypothetical protein [Mycobacteroides salmoniphilum]QCH22797.1 hypothetical protein DSM43276_01043 [Mycobacteroides salmoniphilum]TDZ93901.1 hypothetical protein CCUG62472_02085 [Mycobacteroides salmoniphilum]TEA03365.1 hypothetical protein CCUG60884_02215 [Mycobacteroides salmoniphilum]
MTDAGDGTKNARCTQCGTEGSEIGFLGDSGQAAAGHVWWVGGPLKVGFFGAKRGGARRAIDAWRCPNCGHLELFAGKWL